MRDRELIAAVIAAAAPVLVSRSVGAPIKQAQQPTTQGTPTATTYFGQIITERRYGFEQFGQIWNSENEQFDTFQSQQIETVIQFGVSGPQDPSNLTQNTLPDLVRALASAIQSERSRASLRAAGVGLLRVRDVRIVYALDDKNQHEASPSVDVTLTHRDTYIDTLPAVTAREVVIFRV
jgi:hypothetical protein